MLVILVPPPKKITGYYDGSGMSAFTAHRGRAPRGEQRPAPGGDLPGSRGIACTVRGSRPWL